MSSPDFMRLREVECRQCGSARLDDGTRCACGAYQNPNIQLRNGKWRDVRYPQYPVNTQPQGERVH